MVSAPIVNQSGVEVGRYEFDPADLAPKINKQLLHDVVVMYEANKRVGTMQTKSRGMVRGSTRKLFRQKGTGRARAGAARTPVRRGGGHAFGKKPRDFTYRLPRKAVRLATRMALLSKFQDDQATVLDGLSFPEPKTSVAVAMLRDLKLSDTSCLLVINEYDPIILKSVRNLPNVQLARASDINAYDLLHQRILVITKDAIDAIRAPAAVPESASV
jgi:large subunit ribosomal protein L4